MGIFDSTRNRVAELISSTELDDDPEPQGYSEDPRGGNVIEGGYLEHDPPKDLDDYWRIYEMIGPVNERIDSFASEVIEPGWYITCDSESTKEELVEYFNQVAMLNTDLDRDVAELMERMVIEREVRGTVFLEKVTDDQGRHQALYPLQNGTVTIYTKPGKAILPAPDDDDVEQFDNNPRNRGQTPTTPDGDTAAYVQYDDTDPHWEGNAEVGFTRDEVIKWVRDADIGDARGTSRIKSIADRAEGLIQKLNHNDAAIESKAWPQVVFKFGTEDNPWSRDEVSNFLDNYSNEKLEPGTMTGVSGDVEIDEFAGETADISDDLEFDINMIISGLPGPVYATGGFSQNVAPAVAQAQQRNAIKQVKKTRRELETVFTQYAREVADSHDLEAADTVQFHVGRPQGDVAPEDVQGSIIRYQSDAGGQQTQQNPVAISSDDIVTDPDDIERQQESSNQTTSGTDGNESPQASQTNPSRPANRARPAGFAMNEAASRLDGQDAAELADPRLVSTREQEDQLERLLTELFQTARDRALTDFDRESDTTVASATNVEQRALRGAQDVLDDSPIRRDVEPIMESIVDDTLQTLGQDNHTPTIETSLGVRHRQDARQFAGNVERQASQAIDDMMDALVTQVRRGAQHGLTEADIVQRVESEFDQATLARRARVIARMEAQNAVNTTKLTEYDRAADVAGYEIVNPCNEHTTPLCRNLAGCRGETARVLFDDDTTPSDQLGQVAPDEQLFDGFDPIPPVPPFHYGCRSEIVAVPGDAA